MFVIMVSFERGVVVAGTNSLQAAYDYCIFYNPTGRCSIVIVMDETNVVSI